MFAFSCLNTWKEGMGQGDDTGVLQRSEKGERENVLSEVDGAGKGPGKPPRKGNWESIC